jgi:hypothetical protein
MDDERPDGIPIGGGWLYQKADPIDWVAINDLQGTIKEDEGEIYQNIAFILKGDRVAACLSMRTVYSIRSIYIGQHLEN